MKSQLGEQVLNKFIENYPKYYLISDDNKKTPNAAGFEAWMAIIFPRGSHQSVCGELMRDYQKDYANNDDNYPESVRGMVDAMRQLKPKRKSNRTSNNNKNNRNGLQQNQNGDKNEPKKESCFATAAKCWCCGKPGCISRNCGKADDIPRNQWYNRSIYQLSKITIYCYDAIVA